MRTATAILSEFFSHDLLYNNIINFNIIEKHRDDGFGGVAIAYKNSLQLKK